MAKYQLERNYIRAIALLIQAVLALKFLADKFQLGLDANTEIFAAIFPHAFPYPITTWIYLATVASLIAVWSFNTIGVALSSLFNSFVVICYGLWIYQSVEIHRSLHLSPTSIDFYLYRSTLWDLIVGLLTLVLFGWELSLLYRRWRDSQKKAGTR